MEALLARDYEAGLHGHYQLEGYCVESEQRKEMAHANGKTMKIQINTDNHISGREELAQQAEATVTSALGHLVQHVTRVEVHLSDENGNKTGGRDKRCMMEARLEGHQPIAVTDEAETIAQAIDGAADKLRSALDRTLGRLRT